MEILGIMSNSFNCCIFIGKLIRIKIYNKEGEEWTLAKGELLLPESESQTRGQVIKFNCWNNTAIRLAECKEKLVKVLSFYNPSIYKGSLQDTFEITSFIVL